MVPAAALMTHTLDERRSGPGPVPAWTACARNTLSIAESVFVAGAILIRFTCHRCAAGHARLWAMDGAAAAC